LIVVDCLVSVYFNVGLFNVFGEYDEIFEEMVGILCEFVSVGLFNLVGGCCGIIFVYIWVIVEVVVDLLLCVLFGFVLEDVV
ncbi:hypothetical protein GUF79_12020, partial [Xanthomonas citri pv. citri]|nr:hypothetical protein [Xanthomonas citri pv. citri]